MLSPLITTNETKRRKGLSLRERPESLAALLRDIPGCGSYPEINGTRDRSKARIQSVGGAWISNSAGLSPEVEAIEIRVRSLSDGQLLCRYHDLVDRRLDGAILYPELFELDRIEARLNMSEHDEIDRVAVLRDEWRRERDAIVISIDTLLNRFRAPR